MQTKSAELQMKLNELEESLKGNAPDVQKTIWENDKRVLAEQLQAALLEESQENFAKDIQANGYIMDGLRSGQYTMAELAHTPEDYILQATAVQLWAIEQEKKYEEGLKLANNLVLIAQNELLLADEKNISLSKENYQICIENGDLLKKLKNATDIIEELQVAQGDVIIPEVAPLTAEEQDAQWKADNAKTNNRIKVSRIRNADETGIDTRKSIVTIALTGEEVTTETIYLKGRYIEISAVEAEQLRADYANKKAEIEQSIPTLATPDIPPVTASTGQDEATTDVPFQEKNQVDTAEFGLVDQPQTDNGEGSEESEVDPEPLEQQLEQLYGWHLELKSQVDAINAHLGLVA